MALWKCVGYFSSAIPTQGLQVQSEFTLLKKYLLYMKVEEYNSLKVEIEVEAVCFWIITLTTQYFHLHWCLLFKQKQVIIFGTTFFPDFYFLSSLSAWKTETLPFFEFPCSLPLRNIPEKLDLCFSTWLLHMSTLMCFSHVVEINPIVVSSERRSDGSMVSCSLSWIHRKLAL